MYYYWCGSLRAALCDVITGCARQGKTFKGAKTFSAPGYVAAVLVRSAYIQDTV